MNGIATRFKEGNKARETWTLEESRNILEEAFDKTLKDKDVLCVQDSFFAVNLRPTTAHYLIKKFPELEDIKKDINDIVICRVNKGAINNKMNPTASIWRMKQLGERDEKTVDNKSSDGSMSPIDTSILNEEQKKVLLQLARNQKNE